MTARLGSVVLAGVMLTVTACGSEVKPSVSPSQSSENPNAQPTTPALTATNSPRPTAVFTANPDPLPALQINRTKWAKAGIKDYQYDFSISCFCFFSNLPITMVVHDGELVSMTNSHGTILTSGYEYDAYFPYSTVHDMFQEMERTAGEKYHTVLASYDAEYGFPADIYGDAFAADSQSMVTISNFEVLP